jgi:hypothetical protein
MGLLDVNMLDQATSIRAERNIPGSFGRLGGRLIEFGYWRPVDARAAQSRYCEYVMA